MARQKPSVQTVKRNEPTWQEVSVPTLDRNVAPEKDPVEQQQASPSATESDSEFETENEYEDRTPEDLLREGKQVRRTDIMKAIKIFDAALRAKIDRDKLEQTAPELAEYWLSYGDALYTKEEESGDLFRPQNEGKEKDDVAEDDKETAWQCLDLARLGFDHLLTRLNSTGKLQPTNIQDVWEAIDTFTRSTQLWTPIEHEAESKHLIEDAIFTRLRLGDCNQAETQFERAIEDFSESLRLCMMYQVSHERTLEPTIPLCHCLLAINHEHTEKTFHFAILLIDTELRTKEQLDITRRETLQATKEDLQAQLKEYIEHHEEVKREAREAIMALMSSQEPMQDVEVASPCVNIGTAQQAPGGAETIDLGVVGRKRKKPEAVIATPSNSAATTTTEDNATAPKAETMK